MSAVGLQPHRFPCLALHPSLPVSPSRLDRLFIINYNAPVPSVFFGALGGGGGGRVAV
jgi:hypothetical protein